MRSNATPTGGHAGYSAPATHGKVIGWIRVAFAVVPILFLVIGISQR